MHLVSTTETKNQVKSGLLLDVVVGQGTSVFQLLSSKDKTLLIRWNSFLVLDLGLDVVNGIRWLDIQGDSLAGKSLYENLQSWKKRKQALDVFASKSGFPHDNERWRKWKLWPQSLNCYGVVALE